MTPMHRSLPWLAAVTLLLAAPLQAARVDPDFRPSFGNGFVSDEIGDVKAVMPDGRMIIAGPRVDDTERTFTRLNLDGSIDPTFDSAGQGIYWIRSLYNGQLIGGFNEEDPEQFWLDSSGRRTEAVFKVVDDFGQDGGGRFLPYPGDQQLFFGNFISIDGIARHRLARINDDGTIDLSFDAGRLPDGVDQALALADGKVLLRGDFKEFGGLSVPGLVRLNATGAIDTTFTPDTLAGEVEINGSIYLKIGPVAVDSEGRLLRSFPGTVYRSDPDGMNSQLLVEFQSPRYLLGILPIENGAFLVWGDFHEIGGVDRAYLAKINEDGSVDTGFSANPVLTGGESPLGSYLNGIVRLPDGRLVPLYHALRLLPDGSLDPSFQPGTVIPGSIDAIAAQADGSVLVGGQFTHVGSTVRVGLARLDASGQLDPSFSPDNDNLVTDIRALAVDPDGAVWVGGGATTYAKFNRTHLTRHLANGSRDTDLHLEFSEEAIVRTIAIDQDGGIIFGGLFDSIQGQPRNGLARLNPDHTLDPSFADGIALTGQEVDVHRIETLPDGGLLVAGSFDAWRGERRWGLLKLNAEGELDPGFVANETLAGLTVMAAAAHTNGSVALATLSQPPNQRSMIHLVDSTGREIVTRTPSLAGESDVLGVVALPDGTSVFSVFPNSDWSFSHDRDYTPFLLALTATGEEERRFGPEIDSKCVKAMAVDPGGSLLLGGDFAGVDGMAYANLMRVVGFDAPGVPRMANISTRGQTSTGDRQLIAGFVIEGAEPQRVLIRGVGPTLEDFGIENALMRPALTVHSSDSAALIAKTNDLDWWIGDRYNPAKPKSRYLDMFNRVGAIELTGSRSTDAGSYVGIYDAALIVDLDPGAYTVTLSGENSAVGLVEVYNASGVEADRQIVNLSTRGWVGVDDDRLLGGFVIDRGPKRVLIRAIGPTLDDYGVSGFLANPHLWVVRTHTLEEVATNDNWEDFGMGDAIMEANGMVGAFPLTPGNEDAALILDLEPGAYTAIVSGIGRTTGIALVEVYELPD